ncbi:MAG: hypothetical protein ACI8R4_000242 [Paracoccaceae bacterium]|jgi:hypothetical protein
MKSIFSSALRVLAPLAISGAIVAATAASASEEAKTQVGILKCDVAGGIGLILGSKKALDCVFTKNDGTTETYVGRILKIGMDIGATKDSVIGWAVLAPSGQNDVGALEGKYVGVSAEATVVGGVGANVLVGGGNSFALQPLSLQVQTGLNVAGGIGSVKLEYRP